MPSSSAKLSMTCSKRSGPNLAKNSKVEAALPSAGTSDGSRGLADRVQQRDVSTGGMRAGGRAVLQHAEGGAQAGVRAYGLLLHTGRGVLAAACVWKTSHVGVRMEACARAAAAQVWVWVRWLTPQPPTPCDRAPSGARRGTGASRTTASSTGAPLGNKKGKEGDDKWAPCDRSVLWSRGKDGWRGCCIFHPLASFLFSLPSQ